MLIQANHPGTVEEVLRIVQNADLPATRRRDLVSAINRICTMAGHHPSTLRAEASTLRAAVADIKPASHGIAKQTFANIRSNLVAALALAGVIDPLARGLAAKDPGATPAMAQKRLVAERRSRLRV